MPRQRCGLIGFIFFASLALFHIDAQGSRASSAPETIEFGKAVIRHVWPQGLSVVFEGKAGEVITLKVNSKSTTEGFDPVVRLFDPAGQEEASDDDSGGKGNCLIQEHELKADGEYGVFIEGDDNKEGDVEILLLGVQKKTKTRP